MKQKIHPNWYKNCKVVCACGNTFSTGSTQKEIKVEICAACHPFFTGEMKYVDTMGRVEKFKKKQKKAAKKKYVKKSQRKKQKEKQEAKKEKTRPKSLREMLKSGSGK
jgi:large subunit ribosomal protein L31